MKTYKLANTDLEVTRMAYGTWHIGGDWDKVPPSDDVRMRAKALIAAALEHGINHIDLADIYTMGKSDLVVGEALAQHPGIREKIVLQEKCGIILGGDPDFGPPQRFDFSADHIIKSVETSLQRLGTDYVDLLALHRPDPLVEHEEVAKAFDALHSSGKVRYFGVSNHTAMQIELLKRYVDQPIVVNQLELNILHHYLISDGILANMAGYGYANAGGLLDYCRLNDITIQAWSPVAGGAIFNPADDAPDNIKAVAALIGQLAEQYEVSKEAIAFAWLLRHPAGIQPIIGTLRPERIATSVQADGVDLTRKEWFSLLEAARGESVP